MKYYLTILFISLLNLQAADKPNILLILSDDQAWTDYGFMGHEHIKTPHLDKLASESVLFKRAYVPTALCRPSLMTLATGRYSSVNGVTGNDPKSDSKNPNNPDLKASLISNIDRFDTIAELLTEAGYLTHQSGKWWEGNYQRGGFTHGMTEGYPAHKKGRHGDEGLKIGRKGNKPVTDFMDMAIKEQKPFFLWYAPFMPHTPHTPPKRILEKYKKYNLPLPVAKYYSMCEWFDQACGDLIQSIEDRGIRDNTLIVYVCDNGWIQNPEKNGYAPRSKRSPFEGGTRTPIFFSWPVKYNAQDRKELCSSIDIFPTIVSAAGARMPKGLPGLDLNSFMSEQKEIPRDHIFGETFAHDIADISDYEASLLYRWVIKDNWKLLLTYDGKVDKGKPTYEEKEQRPQLFDLSKDPAEKNNLAKDHSEKLAELAKMIHDWYPVQKRKVITEYK
jgi:arylsulfatase A-like enzyme